MSERNCANCKWWTRRFTTDGFGQCDAAFNSNVGFRLELIIPDDHGAELELMTAPTFGCTEFKPKES